MFLILYVQLLTILFLEVLNYYRQIFPNLFWLVASATLVAFIPNFITSLFAKTEYISGVESQLMFGFTGSIVLVFLWRLLKDFELK